MFKKLIFIDNDCAVLRNVDHLALAPTPAFVYHRSDQGLNSGVMVLTPDVGGAARLWALFRNLSHLTSRGFGGGSDQDVWNAFYAAELGRALFRR